MPYYEGIRVEPCNDEGIHLVENMGGQYIYVKFSCIDDLIKQLNKVKKEVDRRDNNDRGGLFSRSKNL